ncbi:YceI family protein [Glacieibacterium frigidum]|uniref:YceI family protein n=1 Tax=Glacieibacterium frigidum TaxID=2593303 RepID=A0A552UHV5_9SPHN|nr:YceI family protein [Glacieibacterium frigidum]TRW17806.1 YceI family protein [Glacieibacterium frigidum]
MRALIVSLALLTAAPALAAPLDAPSGKYDVDLTHTSVTWRVKHLGLSMYTARFAKVASTVQLDAAKPENSKLEVTIDANSVRTDFPFPEKEDFDKVIGGDARFLDGGKFPQIKFVSTKITPTGPKTGKITGDLTLRGVTKPVTLDATWNGSLAPNAMMKTQKIGVSARGMIKRTDFGMTFGTQFLGDEVELQIEAEYNKAG